jgi:predicted Zn-dependent protease
VRTAVSCLTISLTSLQFSLVSVDQEVAIGRQAQAQVKKQVPELGGDVHAYIADIGRELVRQTEGPKYPYTFSVANYREINAFALPGGPVWINRGAIDAARNESQLAGVLAHEIAHVARRHAAAQLTKGVIADGLLWLLGAVLGNDTGARAAQVAAQVLAGGYLLKFSRDDEREADRVGIAIMRRAGWDQRGMVEFLEILRDRQGRTPSDVEVFLSSHPSPASRVQELRPLARGGGRRDSPRFSTLQGQLDRLPAPRRMPQ